MKLQNKTLRSARFTAAIAATAALLTLAVGCVVTSVYPFYTEKDLVFDPALLGKWLPADETNEPPKGFIFVERLGEKGYAANYVEEGNTNQSVVEFYLFQLNGQKFTDECTTNRSLESIPIHQVSKVLRTEPVFETVKLDYDWLAALLEEKPKTVRHMILHDKEGDSGRILLTADTAELQRFILKHVNDTNAWSEPSVLIKLP